MWRTEDLNVLGTRPLVTPREIKAALPITESASETVKTGRMAIRRILCGEDSRLMVIVGPCSIHDPAAALEYAQRLNDLRQQLEGGLHIIMRMYFEKPRTTVGWKGLINDPFLDGSYDMDTGLRKARELLIGLAEMGLPAATEILEPIVPQYIADLITWSAIGARTTESQTHREITSGLSMPVGFKNSTDGNLQIAINALLSARQAQHFLGIDQDGRTCIIETSGNPWGNVILRGGGGRPNYDPVSVANAQENLKKAGLEPLIMVDCSHANCGKRPDLQAHVLRDVVQQRLEGNATLIGIMLESNLNPGSQPFPVNVNQLAHGVSITDPCLGWEDTERLLRYAHDRLTAK